MNELKGCKSGIREMEYVSKDSQVKVGGRTLRECRILRSVVILLLEDPFSCHHIDIVLVLVGGSVSISLSVRYSL
jgi:hypothetical protein